MIGLGLPLLAVLLTTGEQVRLRRPDRPSAHLAGFALAYAALTLAVTGEPLAAGLLALLQAVGSGAATQAWRRRGPGLWTALAALLPAYLALWWTWAALSPRTRPVLDRALLAFGARLALGAPIGAAAVGHASLLAAACILCWGGGTFLTRAVLRGYAAGPTAPRRGALELAAAEDPAGQGLLRAGRLIGELERFLILILALRGELTAIGFVLAAKSVARFDLARRHGEYFLVGTLCSVGTALLIGLAVRRLLALP